MLKEKFGINKMFIQINEDIRLKKESIISIVVYEDGVWDSVLKEYFPNGLFNIHFYLEGAYNHFISKTFESVSKAWEYVDSLGFTLEKDNQAVPAKFSGKNLRR
jgi:hypothetical protein